jgi:mannose-6-phosphate isomerase-like protein (cupin superfamily)
MEKYSKAILKELIPLDREEPLLDAPIPGGKSNPRQKMLDHWTPAVLLERGEYLRRLAQAGEGSSGETLREYPRHCAMLSFRGRDGVAEMHENFADLFIVLDGRATLVTGGTLIAGVEVEEGETRGIKIEEGLKTEIRAGDVVHVPAKTPHQMLVSGDHTFTAMVFKIQESE